MKTIMIAVALIVASAAPVLAEDFPRATARISLTAKPNPKEIPP